VSTRSPPRLIVPRATAAVPAGVTRTFWLTVKVPADAPPGAYRGELRLTPEGRATVSVPLRFTVRKGTLDPVDIPAGPWGHTIDLPWYEEESASWNRSLALKSLRKLREYGFTTASGLPVVAYRGIKDGVPQLDFSRGDEQMKLFREAGFKMPVVSYCAFPGLKHLLPRRGGDALGGFSATMANSSGRFSRPSRSTPTGPAGCRSTGTSAMSPSALTWSAARPTRRRIARRSPRDRHSSPRPVRSRARTSRTRTSGYRGHCTSPTGTCTTKRESSYSTTRGVTGVSTTGATAGPTGRTCTRPRSSTG